MTEEIGFYPVKFVVDEEPYCLWVTEPESRNQEYITNYNPNYFMTLAQIYNSSVTQENQQEVTLALRLAYGHALEALYALLSAALQVPHFIPGWLMKYRVSDLTALIEKINTNTPIISHSPSSLSSWLEISHFIFEKLEKRDETESVKGQFAKLWAGLAQELVTIGDEYNSIKHGFRAEPGGTEWAILLGGASERPETEAEWAKWTSIGFSEHGSRFPYVEKVQGAKYQWQLKEQVHNWHPADMWHGMRMISLSITNILSFLKLYNNMDSNHVQFFVPQDESLFSAPWAERARIGVASADISMGTLTKADVPVVTREDILSVYPSDEEE